MVASTISRVEGDEEAIRTLSWLGGSFFQDIRLAQFTLDTWAHMGSPDSVDWSSTGALVRPKVELWSITGLDGRILGAMTLHFYGWKRLRQQRYFSTTTTESSEPGRICVRRFDRIVAGATGSIAPYDVAVELGYIAVDPEVRGLGLGRTLFDIFQHRSSAVGDGRSLAFTIVMSRHAHSQCGSTLMSHLIGRGANDLRSAMSLRSVATTMALPNDLFEIDAAAYPTARLAQQRGFRFAGYGRNLGQVWVRDQEAAARVTHPAGQLDAPFSRALSGLDLPAVAVL